MADNEINIGAFPFPVETGDRAAAQAHDDLNARRGHDRESIGPRPATRVFTTYEAQQPHLIATATQDAVWLVNPVGGQPMLVQARNNGSAQNVVHILPLRAPSPFRVAAPPCGYTPQVAGFIVWNGADLGS